MDDDFKLVPREPTQEMATAGHKAVDCGTPKAMAVWRAMYGAAPKINEGGRGVDTKSDDDGSIPSVPVPPSPDDLVKELRFTHCPNDSLHDHAADAIARFTAEREALRADAERFVWYFSDTGKSPTFLSAYFEGVRSHWDIDQWRAAIDAERGK